MCLSTAEEDLSQDLLQLNEMFINHQNQFSKLELILLSVNRNMKSS